MFHDSQENRKDLLRIPLKDLQLATDYFSDENCIGKDGFWKAYRGKVSLAEGYAASIGVKRFFVTTEIANAFTTELKILIEHKHENVISLLGYCEEGEEKIIVYEHALNGRLDEHLDKASLTWGKRLNICIDIASGLDFLHGGSMTGEVVILRDFKSMNILLDGDMNAKIASFGLSAICPVDQETFLDETIVGTDTYIDPEYWRTGLLSKECDIYSFGIVLFEILLKRLSYSRDSKEQEDHLGPLIKNLYKEGKLDDLKFEGTNEQIAPQSLTIFRRIAFQCLHYKREERPTAGEVIVQLKQALEIQVSFY